MGWFNKYSGGVEAQRRAEKKDLLGAEVFTRCGRLAVTRQSAQGG
jgi:hypothetical protein